MEVWPSPVVNFVVIHRDHDAVEAADLRHPAIVLTPDARMARTPQRFCRGTAAY